MPACTILSICGKEAFPENLEKKLPGIPNKTNTKPAHKRVGK